MYNKVFLSLSFFLHHQTSRPYIHSTNTSLQSVVYTVSCIKVCRTCLDIFLLNNASLFLTVTYLYFHKKFFFFVRIRLQNFIHNVLFIKARRQAVYVQLKRTFINKASNYHTYPHLTLINRNCKVIDTLPSGHTPLSIIEYVKVQKGTL